MMLARVPFLLLTLAAVTLQGESYTPGEAVHGDFEQIAAGFLEKHCYECHDDLTTEADLNLLDLGPVDETNAAIWKSLWAQVSVKEMPPKEQPRPEVIERLRFSDWIVSELEEVMADKGGFDDHLDPGKGNFLDHDLLFGELPKGIELRPTSSPARIWRVTPQEHITRLNELINLEPEFDPARPGLRARGDVVPTNHGGELKLYFGTDRITRWDGGTVAYATSVKSIPVVLASNRKHGFENYPDFYSVNSAEATQILDKAENILRYMAYGPLSIANPEQITNDPATYARVKPEGDLRGLPSALTYNTKVARELTPVYDLMLEGTEKTEERLRAAVDYLFEALTFRPPTDKESDEYLALVKDSIEKVGEEDGAFMGLSAIFLDRDALFRPELVAEGKADKHGRVKLQDWELGLAVNHALRYLKPDDALREAIVEGRMRTRADVAREVKRMLDDDSVRKPRILRFFRDYFDHDLGGYICKDNRALVATGVTGRDSSHYRAMFDATASTDRLIEIILAEDRNVLKELLTTQRIVATENDEIYFGRRHTEDEVAAAREAKAKDEERIATAAEKRVAAIAKEIAALDTQIADSTIRPMITNRLKREKSELIKERETLVKSKGRSKSEINLYVDTVSLDGPDEYARASRRSFGNDSMRSERILTTAPAGQRVGILTHPSWLVSHSDAMDNHAIHRGIWIQTRLLGGGIPDVPITVDAQLPDEPKTPLRERMRVTRAEYCWSCHEKMDPLGLPFEMYNHAGLYRTTEFGEPVDTTGEIVNSGDPALDGPVENALEMIQRLSESERVEQVFVRHAFRFWMGRNETLNDRPVLQAAHRAYRENGGSMKALISSLLTSDAFLYRRVGE